jgi:hypothetical protein
MGGHGHRNMYYATGLPGWIRFGFSPGWRGRSPTGLPPTAQYLMQTGQLPQVMSYFQQTSAPLQAPMQVPQITKEQEMQMLEDQAKILGQQLEQIKKRLDEIKKKE